MPDQDPFAGPPPSEVGGDPFAGPPPGGAAVGAGITRGVAGVPNDQGYISAVEGLAQKYGVQPSTLYAMAKGESSFKTGPDSRTGSYSGLYQISDNELRGLGVDPKAYQGMNRAQQTQVFDKYLTSVGFKPGDGDDQLMLTLPFGSREVRQKGLGHQVWQPGSKEWASNPGWRTPGNGPITVGSALNYYKRQFLGGKAPDTSDPNDPFAGPPPSPQDPFAGSPPAPIAFSSKPANVNSKPLNVDGQTVYFQWNRSKPPTPTDLKGLRDQYRQQNPNPLGVPLATAMAQTLTDPHVGDNQKQVQLFLMSKANKDGTVDQAYIDQAHALMTKPGGALNLDPTYNPGNLASGVTRLFQPSIRTTPQQGALNALSDTVPTPRPGPAATDTGFQTQAETDLRARVANQERATLDAEQQYGAGSPQGKAERVKLFNLEQNLSDFMGEKAYAPMHGATQEERRPWQGVDYGRIAQQQQAANLAQQQAAIVAGANQQGDEWTRQNPELAQYALQEQQRNGVANPQALAQYTAQTQKALSTVGDPMSAQALGFNLGDFEAAIRFKQGTVQTLDGQGMPVTAAAQKIADAEGSSVPFTTQERIKQLTTPGTPLYQQDVVNPGRVQAIQAPDLKALLNMADVTGNDRRIILDSGSLAMAKDNNWQTYLRSAAGVMPSNVYRTIFNDARSSDEVPTYQHVIYLGGDLLGFMAGGGAVRGLTALSGEGVLAGGTALAEAGLDKTGQSALGNAADFLFKERSLLPTALRVPTTFGQRVIRGGLNAVMTQNAFALPGLTTAAMDVSRDKNIPYMQALGDQIEQFGKMLSPTVFFDPNASFTDKLNAAVLYGFAGAEALEPSIAKARAEKVYPQLKDVGTNEVSPEVINAANALYKITKAMDPDKRTFFLDQTRRYADQHPEVLGLKGGDTTGSVNAAPVDTTPRISLIGQRSTGLDFLNQRRAGQPDVTSAETAVHDAPQAEAKPEYVPPQNQTPEQFIADNWRTHTESLLGDVNKMFDNSNTSDKKKLMPLRSELQDSLKTGVPHPGVVQDLAETHAQIMESMGMGKPAQAPVTEPITPETAPTVEPTQEPAVVTQPEATATQPEVISLHESSAQPSTEIPNAGAVEPVHEPTTTTAVTEPEAPYKPIGDKEAKQAALSAKQQLEALLAQKGVDVKRNVAAPAALDLSSDPTTKLLSSAAPGLLADRNGVTYRSLLGLDTPRGKDAVLDTLIEAHRKGEVFGGDDQQFKRAIQFVQSMPEPVLRKLGMQTVDNIDGRTNGVYVGGMDIIGMLKRISSDSPHGAAYVAAEEVSHHLETLLPDDVLGQLKDQFKKEVNWKQTKEDLAKYQNVSDEDKFSEWFAKKIAKQGLDAIAAKEQPMWRQVMGHIWDYVTGIVDYLRRGGMSDKANEVLKRFQAGGFDGDIQNLLDKNTLRRSIGSDELPDEVRENMGKVSDHYFRTIATNPDSPSDFSRYVNEDLGMKGLVDDGYMAELFDQGQRRYYRDVKNANGLSGDLELRTLPGAAMFQYLDQTRLASGTGERQTGQSSEFYTAKPDTSLLAEGRRGAPQADALADSVNRTAGDRTISDEDQISMMYRLSEHAQNQIKQERYLSFLKEELRNADKADAPRIKTTIARLEADTAVTKNSIQNIEDALDKGGTSLGRAMRARQLILDMTMTDETLYRRIAENRKGRELTPEDIAKVHDQVQKLLGLVSKLDGTKTREFVRGKADAMEPGTSEFDLYKTYQQHLERMLIEMHTAPMDRQVELAKEFRAVMGELHKGVEFGDSFMLGQKSPEEVIDGLVDQATKAEASKRGVDQTNSGTPGQKGYSETGGVLEDLRQKYSSVVMDLQENSRQAQILQKIHDVLDNGYTKPEPKPAAPKESMTVEALKQDYSFVHERAYLQDLIERKRQQIETGERAPGKSPLQRNLVLKEESKFLGRMMQMIDQLDLVNKQVRDARDGVQTPKAEKALNEAVQARLNKLKDEFGFQDTKDELSAQRMELRLRQRREALQNALRTDDVQSLLDNLGYRKAKLKTKDPAIETLKEQISNLERQGEGFLNSMEGTGFFESARLLNKANVFTNAKGRLMHFSLEAVKWAAENNYASQAFDATLERALFANKLKKNAAATMYPTIDRQMAGWRMNAQSLKDSFGGVVKYARELAVKGDVEGARAALGDVPAYYLEMVSRLTSGQATEFAGRGRGEDLMDVQRFGISRELNTSANIDNKTGKRMAAALDAAVNSILASPGVVDVPFREAAYNRSLLNLVDGEIALQARSGTINLDSKDVDLSSLKPQQVQEVLKAKREEMLKNEFGEIDKLNSMALAAAEDASFANKTWYSKFIQMPYDAKTWERMGMSKDVAHVVPLGLEVFITQFPKIFSNILGYGTDHIPVAAGAKLLGKAASEYIKGFKGEANWGQLDRQRIVQLARRGMVGLAMQGLAAWVIDQEKQGKLKEFGSWNKTDKQIDFGELLKGVPFIGNIQPDAIGGPVGMFCSTYANLKMQDRQDMTAEEKQMAWIKTTANTMVMNQPILQSSKRFMDALDGDSSIVKFLGATAAHTLIPGAIREQARTDDYDRTGVKIRKTGTGNNMDTFLSQFQNNWPEGWLGMKGRESLARASVGEVYPNVPQSTQELFRQYGVKSAAIDSSVDPKEKAIIQTTVPKYLDSMVNSPDFNQAPKPPEDALRKHKQAGTIIDKQTLLTQAVTEGRAAARAKYVYGLPDSTYGLITKYAAKVPAPPESRRENEPQDVFDARMQATGKMIAVSLAKTQADKDWLADASPESRRRVIEKATADIVKDADKTLNAYIQKNPKATLSDMELELASKHFPIEESNAFDSWMRKRMSPK